MLEKYRYHCGQFSVSLTEFRFSGTDVKSFLQTQSTLDLEKLPPNHFHLCTFLDPQGRVESYGWCVNENNIYRYLTPSELADKSFDRLNRFLISEDVEIDNLGTRKFTFLVGPKAHELGENPVMGVMFSETAALVNNASPEIPELDHTELELWRGLTGWPDFTGLEFKSELLNNLHLFDLALHPNKGCYPGQETVSKIATRRGAAYSPVLIELDEKVSTGDLYSFEKKIGSSHALYPWKNKYYLSASLLRDFRVEGMPVHFKLNEKECSGIVRYFPLLSGSSEDKALELYYEATDLFKVGDLTGAEKLFRQAIDLNPTLGDAYESLGVMLGRQERFQEAIDLMQDLVRVNPKSVLAHTNMSLYLMRLGKIEEAEEQKSQATLKSFQSFGDEAKMKEEAQIQKQQKESEWAKRESMFKQVLEIDPEDTLANYGLGSIAVEKADWETARLHLERVIKEDPKYSVAYLALGRALKGLGLREEAKSIWQEGIKVAAAKGDLMPANQMQQELNF